jgi:hypothetical protein
MPGDNESREIALWKEPKGKAKALKLPKGAHGLLLTLNSGYEEQFTLDGRGDEGETPVLKFGAVHGVTYQGPPLSWLKT